MPQFPQYGGLSGINTMPYSGALNMGGYSGLSLPGQTMNIPGGISSLGGYNGMQGMYGQQLLGAGMQYPMGL